MELCMADCMAARLHEGSYGKEAWEAFRDQAIESGLDEGKEGLGGLFSSFMLGYKSVEPVFACRPKCADVNATIESFPPVSSHLPPHSFNVFLGELQSALDAHQSPTPVFDRWHVP